MWNPVNPKVAKISDIYYRIKQLNKFDYVKLGGMTDCFMPLELEKRITYETITLLNRFKIHYLIVTKSAIVSNDEYMKVYNKDLAHFQISITSTSTKDSLKYENASLPIERIKSIEKLQLNGFDVSIRLSPFIDSLIDIDVINNIKCDKILIEFLKVNHWVKKWFDIDYSEYSFKYGGYSHLPLSKKIELINKITGFKQKSIGEYVKNHHEYFSNNINHNRNDCCNVNFVKINIPHQQKLF